MLPLTLPKASWPDATEPLLQARPDRRCQGCKGAEGALLMGVLVACGAFALSDSQRLTPSAPLLQYERWLERQHQT